MHQGSTFRAFPFPFWGGAWPDVWAVGADLGGWGLGLIWVGIGVHQEVTEGELYRRAHVGCLWEGCRWEIVQVEGSAAPCSGEGHVGVEPFLGKGAAEGAELMLGRG